MPADSLIWPIHFVGSGPLDSPEEVLTTISSVEGPRVSRLPDGELGHARWALASYRIFEGLKKQGRVYPEARLKVALPSAFGVLSFFVGAENVPRRCRFSSMRSEMKSVGSGSRYLITKWPCRSTPRWNSRRWQVAMSGSLR